MSPRSADIYLNSLCLAAYAPGPSTIRIATAVVKMFDDLSKDERTMMSPMNVLYESGLGVIGFHPLHADLSQTKPNLFTVEVRGSFAPCTPWFNSEFLLKLSNRLDAMAEMNGNEELGVDGILESPELFWIVPDLEDPKFFRMLFKVKYVPNQTSVATAGEA